jgi:hypothetical protein
MRQLDGGTGIAGVGLSGRMTIPSHIKLGVAGLVALATSLAPLTAAASDGVRLRVDWTRVAPLTATPQEMLRPPTPMAEDDSSAPLPWIGTAPRMSLVARDWAGSRGLWGDMTATDELRPTRSNRMVVSRVRLADGLVAPFAQLGLGEWRVDPTIMPALPREQELAAQAGLGFELSLSRETVVAFEADWTLLMPGSSSDVIADTHPSFWGACVAMRNRF